MVGVGVLMSHDTLLIVNCLMLAVLTVNSTIMLGINLYNLHKTSKKTKL